MADSARVRAAAGCTAAQLRESAQRLRWAGKLEFDRLAPRPSVMEARGRGKREQARVASPRRPKPAVEAGTAACPPAAVPAQNWLLPEEFFAAQAIDGRTISDFAGALIAMGLDCWRDDRLLAGEAVA